MIKWESEHSAFIPLFGGRTRVEETFNKLPHEFSDSISCDSETKFNYKLQTYIHSSWRKVTKKLFKIYFV